MFAFRLDGLSECVFVLKNDRPLPHLRGVFGSPVRWPH